ncbi:MAG: hypothetical protein ACRD5D_00115 [Candidatus Polarisedimenticolia bacterium]
MRLAAGFALLLCGLLGMLLSVHLRGLRFFDRPAPARVRGFDGFLDAVKWILVVGGLGVILSVSRIAAASAGAVLLAAWVRHRLVRGLGYQTGRLRREFEQLRRDRPELDEGQALCLLAERRHPRWGTELIEQMARDYPTIESFAVMVAKMERGFRGFRGRPPAPGGPGLRGEGG